MKLDKVPDELKGLSDMGTFLPSQCLPYEGQEFVDDVRGDVIGGRLIILREDLSEEVHQKALRAGRISMTFQSDVRLLKVSTKTGREEWCSETLLARTAAMKSSSMNTKPPSRRSCRRQSWALMGFGIGSMTRLISETSISGAHRSPNVLG